MKGFWLLPTRRRVHHVQRFIDAALAHGMTTPGHILVQKDELTELWNDYCGLTLPQGWCVTAVEAEGLAAKVREAYERFVSEETEWIGVVTDDQIPESDLWDTALIAHLNGWNAITSDDCDQAPKRMEGATVWSRPLVDAVGGLAPKGLTHLFFDSVWEEVGRAVNVLSWDMSVKVRHLHVSKTKEYDSTSEAVRSFWDQDERVYRDWLQGDFKGAVARIFDLMGRTGVKVERPSMAGVSLMLATPSVDGTYEREFVRSLEQTHATIKAAGGDFNFAEMPYCASVCFARAKLFGGFLRSSHTHMLFVDADMGWNAADVLRLIHTGLDLVGGAGPKKKYPMQFCVSDRAADGSQVPSLYRDDIGALEVAAIGTGFLLISRSCAERMVQSYPELIFDPGEGQTDYALFDPFIVNKTRFEDDFAFCHRWRAIGGKIYCLPIIHLKHVGSHVFSGSLLETMMRGAPQREAA